MATQNLYDGTIERALNLARRIESCANCAARRPKSLCPRHQREFHSDVERQVSEALAEDTPADR